MCLVGKSIIFKTEVNKNVIAISVICLFLSFFVVFEYVCVCALVSLFNVDLLFHKRSLSNDRLYVCFFFFVLVHLFLRKRGENVFQ